MVSDLNIMESVWDHMKRRRQLRRLNPQKNCGNFSKMQEQLTCQVPEKLCAGVPRRTAAVLKAKLCGGGCFLLYQTDVPVNVQRQHLYQKGKLIRRLISNI